MVIKVLKNVGLIVLKAIITGGCAIIAIKCVADVGEHVEAIGDILDSDDDDTDVDADVSEPESEV